MTLLQGLYLCAAFYILAANQNYRVKTFLALACLAGFSIPAIAQQTTLQRKAAAIQQLVAQKHIEPRAVDDRLSSDLFDEFINALDAEGLYVTNADLQALQPYRYRLDDEWNGAAWKFLPQFATLYTTKLQQTDSLVQALCAKPFDFSAPDFYVDDTTRCADEKARTVRWRQRLKYEMLATLLQVTNPSLGKATILKREPEARRALQSKYKALFKNAMLPGPQAADALSAAYFNAYLGCMDAHSNYFDLTDKQNFESGLNPDGYYFGFGLADAEDGTVVISHLDPGGPAWKSGMLNKGDVFLKLKWAGKEPVSLDGLRAADISSLLNQSNSDDLLLYVRKQNATVDSVVLQKQKLRNDENIVKSFVLKGAQNIGYIMLPGFYSDWEEASGSHCAYDVAKEIVKLKQDNIAGLVLDLRFNGGGSLQEAVEMAGIFIDEGSVCQLKKREKLTSLKDVNRGVIWSGPLLLLVNGQSASASEVLAASLQDYNRAVIAGTTTYGKATGQEILPVVAQSGSAVATESTADNGFLKLTTSRLYRNSGKAVQQRGVQPDLLLPDAYQQYAEKEQDEPHALRADTVAAYKYFKPLKPLPLPALKQASSARIAKKPRFAALQSYVVTATAPEKISLQWENAVKEFTAAATEMADTKQVLQQATTVYTPVNNSADATFAKNNDAEVNQRWLKRLAADPYIEEAYHIVHDLINQNK